MPDKDTNYVYIGAQPTNGLDFSDGSPVLTPTQAQAIDLKIDDGLPMTGAVRASFSYQGNCGNGSSNNDGPCFGSPTLHSSHSANACVDDRVTPFLYYTASDWKGSNIEAFCALHIPVN